MHAAFARASKKSSQQSTLETRRKSNAKTPAKIGPMRGSQRVRNAAISGEDEALRCPRINLGLLTEHKRLKLIVFFVPGWEHVPAQAIVQSQVRTQSPAILAEQADVFVSDIERTGVALLISAGDAKKIVSEVGTGLSSLKKERAVVDRIRFDVDLVEMKTAAKFDRVSANDPRQIVTPLIRVIGLTLAGDINANCEIVKGDIFNALDALV